MAADILPKELGRPALLLTQPEIKEQFVDFLREGMSIKEASALVGIDYKSAYNWIKRGMMDYRAENYSALAEFAVEVNKALAEAKLLRVQAIKRAMKNPAFWQAAAWWLERRHPEEFGRQDRVNMNLRAEVHAANSQSIDVSEEEANAFRSLIAKAGLIEADDGAEIGAGLGADYEEFDIPFS